MTAYPLYNPTALFAGEEDYPHRYIVVPQTASPNNILARGTLLGRIDDGVTTSAPKAGGNTGTGTVALGVPPTGANAVPGLYKVTFTGATTFAVSDAVGGKLADGTTGVAYSDQINFTITAGGTAFVVGDGFVITVLELNKFIPCVANATDGSQIPRCVLGADIDVSLADVQAPAYFGGAFAYERMTIDPSWTDGSLRVALQLNNTQIYLRTLGTLG